MSVEDWGAIIAAGENRTVEFKSDRGPLSDQELLEAVVCLTNDSGGLLFVGVEDDGTVTGLDARHRAHPDLLAPFIASRTVPSLAVEVTVVPMEAGEETRPVAVLRIPASQQLVATSDGRVLARYSDTHGKPGCRPLYPYEFVSWRADRGQADFTSQILAEASWYDFDPLEFARLRRLVEEDYGDSALLGLSDQELAEALQLVRIELGRTVPTVAGLLLVGKTSSLRDHLPAHEVAFQVLQGTDVLVNEFQRWPLLRVQEWLTQAIDVRNEEQELMVGGIRVGVPRYDRRGIREAINNALIHRDYRVLGAVHVQLHDAFSLVTSPGGFVQNVRPSNILITPPRPRNPLLADAFKRVGLVERTGRGVGVIYSGQLRNGRRPPSYDRSTESNVTVTMDSGRADMVFVERVVRAESYLRRTLTVSELLVLQGIWVTGEVALDEAAELIQRDSMDARQVLTEMVADDLVRYVDGPLKSLYGTGLGFGPGAQLGKGGSAAVGRVYSDIEARVVALARENGIVRREQVQSLGDLSSDQAYRLLRHLVDQGILVLVGTGRGAHYRLVGS